MQVKQAGAHCPIIGVTASNIRSVHDECIESGMNDVLAKPIRRNDMIKYLANEQGRTSSKLGIKQSPNPKQKHGSVTSHKSQPRKKTRHNRNTREIGESG